MKRFVFLCVVLSSFAVALNAQTAVSVDPKTVVMASLAALGSAPAVLQGTTVYGTIAYNGETGSVVIKTLGQAVRYEVTLPSQQFVTVWVNGKGVRTEGGQTFTIPGGMSLYYRPVHMPLASRMADFSLSDTQMQYIGSETVNGKPAWHVKMWSVPTDASIPPSLIQAVSEFHVFVDQATGLPVKFITYDQNPQAALNRSEIDTYLSDYRNVNGSMVPYRVTRYLQRNVQSDLTLTSVATGVSQPPTDFQ